MRLQKLVFLFSFLVLVSFSFIKVSSADFQSPKVCASGYIQGNVPITQVPDYSYTPDGFLELHFHLNTNPWKFNYTRLLVYDMDCNLIETAPYDVKYAQKKPDYMPWPAVNNLIIRYGKSTDTIDDYQPFFFNGDTGEQLPYTGDFVYLWDRTMYNYPVRYPIHRMIFGYKSDSDMYAETGDLFSTPALPMHLSPAQSKTPVLIVPGVLGTEISKGSDKLWLDLEHNLTDIGDQFMDPLQFSANLTPSDTTLTIGNVIGKILTYDYTESLIKEFTNQGYAEGTNLFLFPYDWRYGVSENTVTQLRQKISDILTQTGASKLDVVAHSTGGLLVKKYVIEKPSLSHIDKAVFVGVPNTGAPKAIKALVQGDDFGNFLVAESEMKKISANMPVAYDLSPSQQYFNTKGSYVKIVDQGLLSSSSQDLNFSQTDSFMVNDHSLNNQALTNSHNLHTADFDNYDMRTAGINLYAIDGCKAGTISKFVERRTKTILGGTVVSYDQPFESAGDGTVPLESATNLPIYDGNKFYALKGEHGKLLSQEGVRQKIVNLITGSTLDVPGSLVTQDISECKLNGKALSVYSPLNIDITDQDGNHAGLASDGVSIENNIPNADFSILGEHKFVYLPDDEGQTYTIKVNGTGSGTFTLKEDELSDNKIPQTQIFNNIPVTSSLVGQINLDSNGTNTTLSLDNNGDGTIDQTIQPIIIKDTTSPEFSVQFNPSIKDVQFSGTDNVSGPEDITVLDNDNIITLSDRAGNTSQMTLTARNRRTAMVAEMQALSYNNQPVNISSNTLKFSWSYDKSGQLSSLKQIVKSRSNYSISAVYNGSSTQITGQDQTGKVSKSLTGLVLLKVSTVAGDLSWSY